MKMKAARFRQSASLIILARNQTANSKFDYNILMFCRTAKTTFMSNHVVFPGGVKGADDESVLWMKYFKKFGVQDKWLKDLTNVSGPRPNIFKKSGPDHIAKEITLRITAIRETFEEIGLLLCRDSHTLNSTERYGFFTDNFDVHHWQQKVHNNPSKFLEMCQELNVVPDLWSLYEWSVWLTPAIFNKRFETVFYIAFLNTEPDLVCEKHEVAEHFWDNPIGYFVANNNKTIWLPPPQVYELSRLAGERNIEDLQKFAAGRSSKGSTAYLPVVYKCNDGVVGILPGDDYYPSDPNKCMNMRNIDESTTEFCNKTKNYHRIIFHETQHVKAILNIQPFNGHLAPIDVTNSAGKL